MSVERQYCDREAVKPPLFGLPSRQPHVLFTSLLTGKLAPLYSDMDAEGQACFHTVAWRGWRLQYRHMFLLTRRLRPIYPDVSMHTTGVSRLPQGLVRVGLSILLDAPQHNTTHAHTQTHTRANTHTLGQIMFKCLYYIMSIISRLFSPFYILQNY